MMDFHHFLNTHQRKCVVAKCCLSFREEQLIIFRMQDQSHMQLLGNMSIHLACPSKMIMQI
nr:hypothetical protein Iba_chr09bCG4440 [Ipomoea batatas]GMD38575.1 hypothetical protein Iba_chr09fCG5300 [Ipomoea batatas]